MNSTAYHEAAHSVAAQTLGLPVTYLSIRPHEDEAGRTRFEERSEGFEKLLRLQNCRKASPTSTRRTSPSGDTRGRAGGSAPTPPYAGGRAASVTRAIH
jgi:hypothetical protein